jgi:ABC-type proline/glycine betaine transport system permease subunit
LLSWSRSRSDGSAFRHPRFRAGVDALLNGVQVVPAVALFGLLVSLLSFALAAWSSLRGLGLAAIGPTPALIGVAAYLMLPLTARRRHRPRRSRSGRDRDGSRHGA